MSNTKYTPAPQEDPDHVPAGPAYSQAPPSYQAADDEARLFAGGDGLPRSSEDNVPDDFKFGGSVAEATIDIRNQFIRKVYTILTVQLLVTGAVSTISFVSPSYKDWIQQHPALVFISVRPLRVSRETVKPRWQQRKTMTYTNHAIDVRRHRIHDSHLLEAPFLPD